MSDPKELVYIGIARDGGDTVVFTSSVSPSYYTHPGFTDVFGPFDSRYDAGLWLSNQQNRKHEYRKAFKAILSAER